MRKIVLAVALLLPAPAVAEDARIFASDLGKLIAAEQPCGIVFDQAAIAAVVEKNVPAGQMDFMTYLDAGIGVGKRNLEQMSATARTAACVQARRVAMHLGLTAR